MEEKLVLGLHFGHDAHACLFADGNLISYVHRERISGIKHHAGLDRECIDRCILSGGVSSNDITHIAITNTQYREFIFEDPDYLHFEYGGNGVDPAIDLGHDENLSCDKYFKCREIADAIKQDNSSRLKAAHISQYPDLPKFICQNSGEWLTTSLPYICTERSQLSKIILDDLIPKIN